MGDAEAYIWKCPVCGQKGVDSRRREACFDLLVHLKGESDDRHGSLGSNPTEMNRESIFREYVSVFDE